MSVLQRLPRKPEARTEKVEDIVERARSGLVRIPTFQRGLKWEAADVERLFDSIHRGYPIGSLLLYKRPARAERVEVGPLPVDAPETSEAWWVVDGQQRITTLTACLARSVPLPVKPIDPYVLYFDAATQKFAPPRAGAKIPSTWVPLPYFLDGARLQEWVFGWQHNQEKELRRVVFEAGSRIREYPIPLYLIRTENEEITDQIEQIFYRVNKTGKPLEWVDVHKALFGGTGSRPSTLTELSEELAEVGMGRLDEKRLLTCLIALRGKDPTQTLEEHLRGDPEVLRGAVVEALPVLRRVLSFLRKDAGIPHVRLLPKSILLDVLTRFFVRHTDPRPRTRLLLARWFWRTVFGAGAFNDRTLRRRGIRAVNADEEESVQRLLGLVHHHRQRKFDLPPAFDARADASRIALLALVHLRPRRLRDGERIDAAGLLETADRDAFVKILELSGSEPSRTPANRIIQGKGPAVHPLLLERISEHGTRDEVLASHAIDAAAAEQLQAGHPEKFLALRSEILTEQVRRFSDRMAAWGYNDRPSIDHLLDEAGVAL